MLGTAILAKSMVIGELSESGQVGYVESGKVFTYDGKGEELFEYKGLHYAKVANEFFDLNNLIKATITFDDGSQAEITKDSITVESYESTSGVLQEATAKFGDMSAIGVVADGLAEPGAILVFHESGGYISRIEFAETIHPINPKFIPGAVLPVVELSIEQLTKMLTPDDFGGFEGVHLDANNQATLNYAHPHLLPILVKAAQLRGMIIGCEEIGYTAQFDEETMISFICVDNEWVASFSMIK